MTPKNNVLIMAKKLIFKFPTMQDQLFDYLRKEQQERVRQVLGALKKRAQAELCVALLDYMETGIAVIPENVLVGAAFMYLTRYGLPDDDDTSDRRIIRPFVINH